MLGAAAQAPAPPLEDLPQYQGELDQLLPELDDVEFASFARALVVEEDRPTMDLPGVDWDVVFEGLRAEAERREGGGDLRAELAYRHGVSLVARGSWSEAEVVLLEALEASAADSPLRGWILCSRAQAASSLERWSSALQLLVEAESAADAGPDGDGLRAWVGRRRAETWVLIGMPELALDSLRERWAEARRGDDRRRQRDAFEMLANALTSADAFDELRELERELAPELERGTWSPEDGAVLEYRFASAEVDAGLRSSTRSLRGRERLEALLRSGLLDGPHRRWCLEWIARGSLDVGDHAAALEAVERLEREAADAGIAQDPGRVERVALRARAALVRYAAGEDAGTSLAAHLSEVREAWSTSRAGWADVPTRDGGVGYLLLSRRQGLVDALLGLLVAIDGPERGAQSALEWLVEAQALSTLSRRLDAPAPGFDAARTALLSERRGLLAWVPLRNHSYLLAADGERSRVFVLDPSHVLEGATEGLLDALDVQLRSGDGDAAGFDAAVARATDALLPPAALAFLDGWDELYLCGLDDLGLVPFELLGDGTGGTQGARRALARLPSIPVGLALVERAAAPAPDGVCVVVADRPDPEAARRHQVEALRTGGFEDETLLAGWGAYRLSTLGHERATYVGLREDLRGEVGLVHVLGHGVRRTDERPQGILFASDVPGGGAAYAADIEGLRAPPLVVLSVCGANRSRMRRGDGARSDLTAAWFVAGSAATASAGTDLELGPTLRVGALVHEGLREGLPLARALQRARATAAPGRDRLTAHLLQVSGAGFDARLPAYGERGAAALWLIASGTLLVLALAWFTWSKRTRPAPHREPGAPRSEESSS